MATADRGKPGAMFILAVVLVPLLCLAVLLGAERLEQGLVDDAAADVTTATS